MPSQTSLLYPYSCKNLVILPHPLVFKLKVNFPQTASSVCVTFFLHFVCHLKMPFYSLQVLSPDFFGKKKTNTKTKQNNFGISPHSKAFHPFKNSCPHSTIQCFPWNLLKLSTKGPCMFIVNFKISHIWCIVGKRTDVSHNASLFLTFSHPQWIRLFAKNLIQFLPEMCIHISCPLVFSLNLSLLCFWCTLQEKKKPHNQWFCLIWMSRYRSFVIPFELNFYASIKGTTN